MHYSGRASVDFAYLTAVLGVSAFFSFTSRFREHLAEATANRASRLVDGDHCAVGEGDVRVVTVGLIVGDGVQVDVDLLARRQSGAEVGIFHGVLSVRDGERGWIRTNDLGIMSPTL